MFDHLIPLYRLEKLYTLFYDEKDGEIYKIQHRKESDFGTLVFVFVVILFMNLFDTFYANYATLPLNIGIFLVSLGLTFYLAKREIKREYQFETQETSYLYEDQVKKESKKAFNQFRMEGIAAVISLFVSLLNAYLFFKNDRASFLIIACIFFAIMLTFLFKKPVRRKELLEKINE